MTREEAIKALNEYGTLFPSDKSEAIDMAIEALQTPPISQRSMYQLGYIQGQEDALKDRPRGEWVNENTQSSSRRVRTNE